MTAIKFQEVCQLRTHPPGMARPDT